MEYCNSAFSRELDLTSACGSDTISGHFKYSGKPFIKEKLNQTKGGNGMYGDKLLKNNIQKTYKKKSLAWWKGGWA